MVLVYGLDRLAIWLLTIAIILTVYQVEESVASVAFALLVYVAARAAFPALISDRLTTRPVAVMAMQSLRVVATASLVLFSTSAEQWWAMIAFGTVAGATGGIDRAYHQLLPVLGERSDVPRINNLIGFFERGSALLGPLLAGLLLILFAEQVVTGIAAALLLASIALSARWFVGAAPHLSVIPKVRVVPLRAWNLLGPHRTLRNVAAGLLFVAAIGVLVRVALVEVVVDQLEYAGGSYGLLIALIGIGALAGPVPVDRLLGHLSVEVVFAGGVVALAVGAIIVGAGGHVLLIVPVLLASGLVIVTLDLVASVTLRRIVREDEFTAIDRLLLRAVVIGQVASLGMIIGLTEIWSLTAAVVLVSSVCIVVMTAVFLLGGGIGSLTQVVSTSRKKLAARREMSG